MHKEAYRGCRFERVAKGRRNAGIYMTSSCYGRTVSRPRDAGGEWGWEQETRGGQEGGIKESEDLNRVVRKYTCQKTSKLGINQDSKLPSDGTSL